MKQLVLLAAVMAGPSCLLSWCARPARADDPAPSAASIYDGQWSLEFGLATQPGGYKVGSASVNILFQATKSSFQVDKNGSFSWEEREHGLAHGDYISPRQVDQATYAPFLRAQGQVLDKQTRTLKVTLGRSNGNGRLWGTPKGMPAVATVSASGATITIAGSGGTVTIPLPVVSSVWELKPTSIETQELGPDQQREIVTYRGRRQATTKSGYPVTEHIEVIQVRQLKLVPRG